MNQSTSPARTSARRSLFFAGALGLVLAACSGSFGSDGSTGNSEDDLSASKAACQGKSCGDTCTICNGKPGCVETAVLKQCNEHGRCSSKPAVCALDGGPAPDSGVLDGGPAPDSGALDGGPAPDSGALDGGAYEPCAGKTCGLTCTLCAPWDVNCVETAVLKFCHSDGKCHDYPPACIPPPPYYPCAGKACGATCTICDPRDPTCVETAVVKECQSDGSCAPAPAACN